MYLQQHKTFGPWVHRYDRIQRQPSWVLKLALVAAVLVIVVPLLILTFAAILIGVVVFTIGSLVASGLRVISDLFTRRPTSPVQFDDGRRNVRIIRR